VISLGGEVAVEGHETAEAHDESSAAAVGFRLADRLLKQGAAEILGDARAAVTPVISEP
jgi:hypothetical protein